MSENQFQQDNDSHQERERSATAIRVSQKSVSRRKFRYLVDRFAQGIISLGGIGVMVTLLLLFVFLIFEVAPLFRSATIERGEEFVLENPPGVQTLHLAVEEQVEVGFRLLTDANTEFFRIPTGDVIRRESVLVPQSAAVSSFALAQEETGVFAFGLDSGQVVLAAHDYRTGFAGVENTRTITPVLNYPLGEMPLEFFSDSAVIRLAVSSQEGSFVLAAVNSRNQLRILRASRQRSLIGSFDPDANSEFELQYSSLPEFLPPVEEIFLDGDQRRAILLHGSGRVTVIDIAGAISGSYQSAELNLPQSDRTPTIASLLLGGVSLLAADENGDVHQYFFANQGIDSPLVRARTFPGSGRPIAALAIEQRNKNFVSVDETGLLRAFNTTANRESFQATISERAPIALAVAPRGNALLSETEPGRFALWHIDNPHPDVSWAALWDRVWYEGYAEPDYVWQSSATDNAFEPKYSLVPLSFGTLKAAFYAMLFAAPLAVCGAIFTGYFMAPAMRRKVKPMIELMEALPTVVLGFLAGLWLAPFIESNLLGVFTVLVILPISVLLASLIWTLLPKRIRHRVPDGWEAALLVPVVLVFGWLAFVIAVPLESIFFAGDMRSYITNELGITYDQRNAMVVGFAMGFAVIPTVFSIAEDAIFNVPRHLPYGSLALGATPWQSLYFVVLPTASPGIFSALMIGLGRAVGETMIVLMATGNTPIMDINLFEGMRTLAANIAVEIPESEVDSTHYRILFLAALVLFVFTFLINTVAETVRQRLRERYSVL